MVVDDVMKRWRSLRDTHRSVKTSYERKLRSGAEATEEPEWKWWKLLKFLMDSYTSENRYVIATKCLYDNSKINCLNCVYLHSSVSNLSIQPGSLIESEECSRQSAS